MMRIEFLTVMDADFECKCGSSSDVDIINIDLRLGSDYLTHTVFCEIYSWNSGECSFPTNFGIAEIWYGFSSVPNTTIEPVNIDF